MTPGGKIGWRDHLLGAALFLSYLALLLVTSRDLAMSRDESFYVIAAERYGAWFEQLFEDPAQAATSASIDTYWSYNSEHPALMKTAFALSWIAQKKWGHFPIDSMAFRLPGMITGSLLLWLIYIFGARVFSRQAGVFSALAFALLPRPFYHAHLDCFDIPITFFLTLVAYCYWRSLRSVWWAALTGIAYGLALATKHNAWILPGVLLIHWCWVAIGEMRARRSGSGKSVSLIPWWLVFMVLLGIPIFLGSWPWLWSPLTNPDPWAVRWENVAHRFGDYAGFHIHHVHYNIAFLGQNYFRPPFPKSYPYLMTFFTVPTTTLALAVVGLWTRLPALLPDALRRAIFPESDVRPDRIATDVLLFGCFYAPIFVYLLPDTPIFGGTKHWFPAYPWMCLFAGAGFRECLKGLQGLLNPETRTARRFARVGIASVLLAPAAFATVHSHPFGLSHYSFAAGGVPGAADLGLNRQFWGFTTGSLAPYFRRALPNGGTVWICDTTWDAWLMMQRDGMIPRNIQATSDLANADIAIVHIEHHFVEVDFQIWVAFGTTSPSEVLTYDGVPIIDVYENPKRPRR